MTTRVMVFVYVYVYMYVYTHTHCAQDKTPDKACLCCHGTYCKDRANMQAHPFTTVHVGAAPQLSCNQRRAFLRVIFE